MTGAAPDGGGRAGAFLDRLSVLTGRQEDALVPFEVREPTGDARGSRRITAVEFHGWPEPDLMTGITYGLSTWTHPAWRHGHPELALSVASPDPAWAAVPAYVASGLAGRAPFAYGDTIRFGGPIAEGSTMTAFVVFAPWFLQPDEYHDLLEVGDGGRVEDRVSLQGLYPIHQSEVEFIGEHGFERFWRDLEWDPLDPARPPAV